jgi:FkbM family methyltransferase
LDYDLEYVDLVTLCPQWNDLFIRHALSVHLNEDAPRILDCGANVGLASLYFKKMYPAARITAFEADPEIASVLHRNLSVNRHQDIEIVQAAVWTETGTVRFLCEGADSGAVQERGGNIFETGVPREVPSIRLKDVLAREPVAVLKLDIEGAEEAVLEDCRDALDDVRVLFVDVHELDPRHRVMPRVLGILEQAGFLYSIDDLCPLPWRPPIGNSGGPFPGIHLTWVSLVRAFRD